MIEGLDRESMAVWNNLVAGGQAAKEWLVTGVKS